MPRPTLAVLPSSPREPEACARCVGANRCWPDDPEVRATIGVARRVALARGDALWRQSEPFAAVFVIASGSLRLATLDPSGREQVTGFAFAGEVVGLDGFALGAHPCSATALEPTTACRLLWQANGNSEVYTGLEKALLRRVARVRARQATRPAATDAVAAVTGFFDMLRARMPERWRDGRLSLPMSRSDIASHLGIAPETLSRCFRALQRDGLLEASGRELHWRPAADAEVANR